MKRKWKETHDNKKLRLRPIKCFNLQTEKPKAATEFACLAFWSAVMPLKGISENFVIESITMINGFYLGWL